MKQVRFIRCEVCRKSGICTIRYGFTDIRRLRRFSKNIMPVLPRYPIAGQVDMHSCTILSDGMYCGLVWNEGGPIHRYTLEKLDYSELSYYTTMRTSIDAITIGEGYSLIVVPRVVNSKIVDIEESVYLLIYHDWCPYCVYKTNDVRFIKFISSLTNRDSVSTKDISDCIVSLLRKYFKLYGVMRETRDQVFRYIGVNCDICELTKTRWSIMAYDKLRICKG